MIVCRPSMPTTHLLLHPWPNHPRHQRYYQALTLSILDLVDRVLWLYPHRLHSDSLLTSSGTNYPVRLQSHHAPMTIFNDFLVYSHLLQKSLSLFIFDLNLSVEALQACNKSCCTHPKRTVYYLP